MRALKVAIFTKCYRLVCAHTRMHAEYRFKVCHERLQNESHHEIKFFPWCVSRTDISVVLRWQPCFKTCICTLCRFQV